MTASNQFISIGCIIYICHCLLYYIQIYLGYLQRENTWVYLYLKHFQHLFLVQCSGEIHVETVEVKWQTIGRKRILNKLTLNPSVFLWQYFHMFACINSNVVIFVWSQCDVSSLHAKAELNYPLDGRHFIFTTLGRFIDLLELSARNQMIVYFWKLLTIAQLALFPLPNTQLCFMR